MSTMLNTKEFKIQSNFLTKQREKFNNRTLLNYTLHTKNELVENREGDEDLLMKSGLLRLLSIQNLTFNPDF